jgi:hypothetical protein
MARRVAPVAATVLAAAAVPLAFVLPGIWGALPLAVGLAVCAIAYVSGYELAFVAYAIACWCMAAVALAVEPRLDSAPSASFADASYIAAAVGLIVSLVRRHRLRQ